MDTLSRSQAVFTVQVDAYVAHGYHHLADLTEVEFRDRLDPVRSAVDRAVHERLGQDADGDHPFVVVVTSRLVPPGARATELRAPGTGRPGVVDPGHSGALERYAPIDGLGIPEADAYLLLDVARGDGLREIAPAAAIGALRSMGRTPLTLDEGLSLATVHPEVLEPDAGFLLAGSRAARRVPAIWLTAGAPTLGWGGEETPETWLGVASAAARLAA